MSATSTLMAPLFRCVRAKRAGGWPPLSVMQDEARWNPYGQAAIYAAFDPELAIEEKLQHATMPIADAVVALFDLYSGGAIGGPVQLAVVTFAPFMTDPDHTMDARSDTDPRRTFAPFMERGPHDGNPTGYDAPQRQGQQWMRAGNSRLIVPSYPYFVRREIGWTNVFFVGGVESLELV